MKKMGLREATHQVWGINEPHTYFHGMELINGVWHLHNLEVTATLLLSFHEGVGDHRSAIVDVTTTSAIGKQEFRVIHPSARRLSSGNVCARSKYIAHLEQQMDIHRMVNRLRMCKEQALTYPAPTNVQKQMQQMDRQVVEMQQGSKRQCQQIYMGAIPFNEPVRTIYIRKRAYQELAKGCDWPVQKSNVVRNALKAGILTPCTLTKQQCLDRAEACSCRLASLRGQAGGLRKVHLWDCLICAKSSGDDDRCKGILQTIEREEKKSIWWQINRAIDDPSLGAVPLVQRMEHREVVDIYKTEAMNCKIQVKMEQRFDLSMSAPITVTSLHDRLGFLSDTKFAMQMLRNEVHIHSDVDTTTTLVLEEIIRLFDTLQDGHIKITLGAEDFKYYWRRIRGIHFGHYKTATYSETLTDFFARKIMMIARCGCPPERWGHGLQVPLEKIARVALVTKLRAILLMEGDFNYMNRWIFGKEAINKLYKMGYVPGNQYSQKESMAEDARLNNQLTMDLSRQMKHPLATMSADANKCYNQINHIVMSLLLLAIVGSIGSIVAMLFPIQTMKFFQRTARGDSTTFIGGARQRQPLTGIMSREWGRPSMLANA